MVSCLSQLANVLQRGLTMASNQGLQSTEGGLAANLTIPTAAFVTTTRPDTGDDTSSIAAELRDRGCEATTSATGLKDDGKENEHDNEKK